LTTIGVERRDGRREEVPLLDAVRSLLDHIKAEATTQLEEERAARVRRVIS